MRKNPIDFMMVCLALCALFFGCSTTQPANTADRKQYADPFVQRTVTDHQGRPLLRITCEYIGRQPYEGYPTHAPWKTREIDFYNIRFENLTRHKITFISKKVYQKVARHDCEGSADAEPILTEFADFSKQPDSDFDRLEPLEERKLINRAFKACDNSSHTLASILLQIRYLDREYAFNLRLQNGR